MRTPTDCCASTSPKGRTSLVTVSRAQPDRPPPQRASARNVKLAHPARGDKDNCCNDALRPPRLDFPYRRSNEAPRERRSSLTLLLTHRSRVRSERAC